MFEKSLVDLIRGLRGHKGNEADYIQSALKECRGEIRSQDMDIKATALLKLIYLEMFGYDMAWAAFNVLEVMASPKQMQKRVGYLAAVQTFRPETEVLMLAENLLKKDLTSPSIPTLTLPLVTLPHIVTSSLALSILSELLPRLSHSQPSVRKKTIVTLYRLALVYPETLRVAWPKIKERLLDEEENSSVTAATVNVVCELGWRRPQDFLALAPRLFDLLVANTNNWMAIKIIKLFAVLTPLEPRLVKKLVRPLTKTLQETGAMSLLYECISGIIQGGILDGGDTGIDVDDIADLCISKLRGMIVLEGDPNLKYVALLAFNKIVGSHPMLVSMQQDVIMACLDDPDISIKMQALELVSGMVSTENLQAVVNRLVKQLANAPKLPTNGAAGSHLYDPDNTDLEQRLVADKRGSDTAPLPDEYRHEIVSRILDMCCANTYANITDFEWYIDILVHLARHLPSDSAEISGISERILRGNENTSLGSRIGFQILDIAVRVKELRPEATRAAETLVLFSNRTIVYASHGGGQNQILKSAAWVCGEFAPYLSSPYEVLNSLVHDSSHGLAAPTIAVFTQSIPKVISQIASISNQEWNTSRGSTLALLLARTTDFLEKLSSHPNLEVQERSVEFLELLKLASEALSAQSNDAQEAPLLMISAIPNLFSGSELNPVAAAAQRKVPLPSDLDLDTSINPELPSILQSSQIADSDESSADAFDDFYHEREPITPAAATSFQSQPVPTTRVPEPSSPEAISYQSAPPDSPNTRARRKAERLARSKDDPFYIAPPSSSGRSTPIHDILRSSNGAPDDLDIDSIPIIDLQIDSASKPKQPPSAMPDTVKRKKKTARNFVVAADETLESPTTPSPFDLGTPHSSTHTPLRALSPGPSTARRPTRNLLSVDSTSLSTVPLSLSNDPSNPNVETALDIERRKAEEAEMAAALAEVERKRLEMQREIEGRETAWGKGVEEEGVLVKRRKKRREKVEAAGGVGERDVVEGEVEAESVVKKKTKKKKKMPEEMEGEGVAPAEDLAEAEGGVGVVKKKKKKVKPRIEAAEAAGAGGGGGGGGVVEDGGAWQGTGDDVDVDVVT